MQENANITQLFWSIYILNYGNNCYATPTIHLLLDWYPLWFGFIYV